jgi:site-specific DNA-methyltransferase (adenine-specific)
MPESTKDRFTDDFERFFWFTKNGKYYFEQQKEPYQSKVDHSPRDKASEKYKGTGLYSAGGRDYYSQGGRNKRTVWAINTKGYKGAHFATYPEELVITPIIACCPPDGIVLDPFIGSGTSGVVARKNGKNFIGIELKPDHVRQAVERLGKN